MSAAPTVAGERRSAGTVLGLPPVVWLAAILTVAVATVLDASRDGVFLSDELTWLAAFDGYDPEELLTPHNGHLIVLLRLLYEGLPDVFGGSYLPFRILSAAALAGAGACFYAFARPRVPPAIALGLTALALFMGSAEVVTVSPLGLPTLLSAAFGLGAIVAADRGRDGLGCIALLLAMGPHTPGVLIGIGLFLYVLLTRRTPRALAAYGVPLVLYGIWWLWALKFDQSLASADNIPTTPWFMAESATVVAGSLSGLTPLADNPIAFMERVLPAVAIPVVVGSLGFALWLWRRRAIGPWALAIAAILVLFWAGAGLAESAIRQPTTPRLVAFGAVFALLLAVAVLERLELPRGGWAAIGALIAFAIAGNAVGFVRGVDEIDGWAEQARVQLGALELAGDQAAVSFTPAAVTTGAGRIPLTAAQVAALRDEHGIGEGYVDEIRTAPAELRTEADAILATALGLQVVVTPAPLRTETCETGRTVELPPGAVVIRAGDATNVGLSRFGPSPVPVGYLENGQEAQLEIPDDGAPETWTLSGSRPVRACR